MTDIKIEEERAFSSWLCNIEGIGRKTQRKLIAGAGSARAVYGMKEEELGKIISPEQVKSILEAKEKSGVLEHYQKYRRQGIRYLPWHDAGFPARLRRIPDPPAGIYVMGELPEERMPAIAVVGARSCSEYGRMAARKFAGALAGAGVNVISGLARGIDGIGQEAALAHGGKTYAVMGCGVDICYPEENRVLYEKIKAQGGILSEVPPGTVPAPGLFPQRNRIISGLSDVVLVVEAREKSGTLITVDMALEQGRDVAVIPGRITDRLSLGCNRLVRQGAELVLEPADVLGMLGQKQIQTGKPENSELPGLAGTVLSETDPVVPTGLSGVQLLIYEVLDYTPQSVSQICSRLEEKGQASAIPEVMHGLMGLVGCGACVQDGGWFGRKGL